MPRKYVKNRNKGGATPSAGEDGCDTPVDTPTADGTPMADSSAAASPAVDTYTATDGGSDGGDEGSSTPMGAAGASAEPDDALLKRLAALGGGAAGASAADAAYEAYLREALPGDEQHHKLMEEAISKLNITTSTYDHKIHPNSRDVKVSNLTVILNGKPLLEDSELQLNYGCRYGLIGPNGCGKSILMTIVGRRLVPLPRNLDVFHLVSEVEPTDLTALECVLAVDAEKLKLEEAASELEGMLTGDDSAEQTAINDRLCEIYERLDVLAADNAEARAAEILHGLGFTIDTMNKMCKEFSGGWRMRVALARALFVQPDLLLLDEPTAHLDFEAVVWLENYLSTWKRLLLIVSHSQDFMNNVCTDIIRLHKKRFEYYGGNYDQYVVTRTEKETDQMKRYEKQQTDIAQIKDFVARFGHGTRKLAQQAQSREKLLAKMMEGDMVEKVDKDVVLKMRFPDPGKLPPPVLQLQNITFAYPGRELLYENVDFGVDLDSRIALVGPNGRGKTTLLKLMTGELIPVKGAVRPHPHLRIARYTQHFVDTLDLNASPLEFFQRLLPDEPLPELRKRIGRYGVTGDYQTTKMAILSEGIKSRVVFATMALRSPHLLLLDEPTNALDVETIDSLAAAINEFQGGVVLVSHDMRLISQVAKEIYECDHCKVTRFPGDIMAYKAKVAGELDRAAAEFESQRKARAAAGKKL